MSFVLINNDGAIKQPSGIKEELVRQVHDRVSVKGVQRRIWLADKHQVTLTWTAVNLTEYAYLAQYLYNQAQSVIYTNSVTGVSFTGFPTVAEDTFMPGASWLKDLSVTILQV